MVDDLEHRKMQEGEAEGFANDTAGSKDLFLWEDEGRVPMLYTEQDNVCSNATYKRVGYQLNGQLTQFVFDGD